MDTASEPHVGEHTIYTARFTDEITTIIREDSDWDAPEYCFILVVDVPDSDDTDIAHIDGNTIPTVLAVEFDDAEEWEPEIYTESIEATGWKVLTVPNNADGEWVLEWIGSNTA